MSSSYSKLILSVAVMMMCIASPASTMWNLWKVLESLLKRSAMLACVRNGKMALNNAPVKEPCRSVMLCISVSLSMTLQRGMSIVA